MARVLRANAGAYLLFRADVLFVCWFFFVSRSPLFLSMRIDAKSVEKLLSASSRRGGRDCVRVGVCVFAMKMMKRQRQRHRLRQRRQRPLSTCVLSCALWFHDRERVFRVRACLRLAADSLYGWRRRTLLAFASTLPDREWNT